MKTAIYIEDGLTQLVLSPESDFEKGVVSQVNKGEQNVKIYVGGFYGCRGGWMREKAGHYTEDSLIIVMNLKDSQC